jgi:hypothetical protein
MSLNGLFGAIPIDRDEEEEPDNVNEMPIPSSSRESKMGVRRELPLN